MYALDFYTSVCRIVMCADPSVEESWTELRRLLPCLRQSLGCNVCFNILRDPVGPNHNVCRHFVCAACAGGKMRLKPACSWCKDHWSFVPSPSLEMLVTCFHKLCSYVLTAPLGDAICSLSVNGETNNLKSILLEGKNFVSASSVKSEVAELSFNPQPSTSTIPETTDLTTIANGLDTDTNDVLSEELDDFDAVPTFSFNKRDRSKRTVKRSVKIISKAAKLKQQKCKRNNKKTKTFFKRDLKKKKVQKNRKTTKSLTAKLDQDSHVPLSKKVKLELQPPALKPLSTCNCGKSGNFNQLTCIGQRCPCYSMKLPCLRTCKCRGCRNPKKDPSYPGACSSAVLRSGTRNTSESLCVNI